MKNRSQLTRTVCGNCMQPVLYGSVVVAGISEISKTGLVVVTPKMGKKTRPDWTLKH